jgi:hypothetical protein
LQSEKRIPFLRLMGRQIFFIESSLTDTSQKPFHFYRRPRALINR